MHLLVPGAYQRNRTPTLHHAAESLNAPSGAGCLPTSPTPTPDPSPKRLNTPCGAGCLSTEIGLQYGNEKASQYTMWCWVLIDLIGVDDKPHNVARSQYTMWCWVLIDGCQ